MQLPMRTGLSRHLLANDGRNKRTKEYKRKPSVKKRRQRDNYQKIRDGIKKARDDEKKGATYRTGMGIENNIPPVVEKLDEEEKKRLGVECTLPGCYAQDHRRRSSKKCTYHHCTKDNVQASVEARLREIFPTQYGEFRSFIFLFFVIFVIFVILCNLIQSLYHCTM